MTKILSIISVLLLLSSCSGKTEEKETELALKANVNAISNAFGNGRIESEFKVVLLASPSTGIVKKIFKEENELVKKGDVLAELERSAEDARIEKVLAQIKKAKDQYDIDMVEIQEGEKRSSNSAEALRRSEALIELGAETQQDFDDATLNYELEQSKLNKALTRSSITDNEIKALYAELEVAKIIRNQKKIIAPADGKILEWQISPGEGTQTTNTIAQFAPEGEIIAVCEIDELLANKIQEGQRAIVRAQNEKSVIGEGQVYFLSDFLNRKSIFGESSSEAVDRRVRTVKIRFKEPPNLLINSRIQCEIVLDSI